MDNDYVWRELSGELVFSCPYYRITRDRLLHPRGHEVSYYVIRPARQAAAVVPVDEAGRVLLVQQWRHAVGKLLWSIPAGAIDDGEAPAEGAARELYEETGYRAARLEPLVTYHPSPGVSAQTHHLFVAADLHRVGQPDSSEIHALRWFDRDEIERMIDANEVEDGLCLTGLLRWLRVARRNDGG